MSKEKMKKRVETGYREWVEVDHRPGYYPPILVTLYDHTSIELTTREATALRDALNEVLGEGAEEEYR